MTCHWDRDWDTAGRLTLEINEELECLQETNHNLRVPQCVHDASQLHISQFALTSFLSFNKYPINKLLEIDHLG